MIDTHPGLELLYLLLASLHGDLLSLIQTVLQVFDGLLHVLLHTLQVRAGRVIKLELSILESMTFNGLIPAASLSIERALKSVHNSLMVSFCLLHLFIFFGQLALNISFHLIELELGSENLPLLMLQ
uniref:Uncharacterized protein n=1 Tax=Scophthalmus maximus TaxID=52904 RepID=A0A8D3ARK5_SCOMX